jgi:preprotein translocase subunit SecE
MTEQVQEQGAGSGADKLKVGASIALVIAGIVAYYWLGARPDWQRWLGMVAGLVLAVAVFATSARGLGFWRFILDSRIELRKVVWPNRQESLMTTGVVIFFVVVAGVFFWLLDLLLAWATQLLTGQGG